MLRVDAEAEEISELGRVLHAVEESDPFAFAALFDPTAARLRVAIADDGVDTFLRGFGLIGGDGTGSIGAHRIRRRGGRYYVMEIDARGEYRQDVWPETDALLAVLDASPEGPATTTLDMGTGTGIVAIESAARGHTVVATDLFPSTIALARFNAQLNGLAHRIDFRLGHLFEPVRGERFSLVLTAPHYSRVSDQLRTEALVAAPAHVAEGGKLAFATQLEWEGESGALPHVEVLLRPLADAGARVRVTPIFSTVKRAWFQLALADPPIAHLVSRHRFLITMEPAQEGRGGALEVERPAVREQLFFAHVPLARLRLGPPPLGESAPRRLDPRAVITTIDDVKVLEQLFAQLAAGFVEIAGEVPSALLDACRFGERTCVSFRDKNGASGAILDGDGGVRPCSHGGVVGRVGDRCDDYLELLRRRAHEAFARRGCATCVALPSCSRCLFPAPLDEARYCDLVRARHAELPALGRLWNALKFLGAQGSVGPHLRVKLRARTGTIVAARDMSSELTTASPADDALHRLQLLWRERQTWVLALGDRRALAWREGTIDFASTVSEAVAGVGELLGEGARAEELAAWTRSKGLPESATTESLARIADLLEGE